MKTSCARFLILLAPVLIIAVPLHAQYELQAIVEVGDVIGGATVDAFDSKPLISDSGTVFFGAFQPFASSPSLFTPTSLLLQPGDTVPGSLPFTTLDTFNMDVSGVST